MSRGEFQLRMGLTRFCYRGLVSVGLRVPANAIASNIRMSACTRRGFWTSATAWSAQPASPEYGAGVRTAEPYAGERNGNSSARADLVAGRTGRDDGAEQVYCHGVRGSAHHTIMWDHKAARWSSDAIACGDSP